MALRAQERKRFFQGWCSGKYVAERDAKGAIPFHRETYSIRITRFHADQCVPIAEEAYGAFEHDLDGGVLAEGDFRWYGTLYRHPAGGLRIRSISGPMGVTREGSRTYGEFAGPFVGYVSDVVQVEVPDAPVPEQVPEPPPEPGPPKVYDRSRIKAPRVAVGEGWTGVVSGLFVLWSLIAILGALPGFVIGVLAVLLIGGFSALLGGIMGGLLRYTLRIGLSFVSLLTLALLVIGLVSFLFGPSNGQVRARTQEAVQRTTRHVVQNGTGPDTSITNHLRWSDNERRMHEMEWEVLRSECLNALINLRRMELPSSTFPEWVAIYDSLRSCDSAPLARLASAFDALRRKEKLDRGPFADAVVTCVQSIPYALIVADQCPPPGSMERKNAPCKGLLPYGVNPPSAFMADLTGDCDSRSLLLMDVLRRLGFDAKIMMSTHYHHAMLGLSIPSSGAYLTLNGKVYYFWETTVTGFRSGEIHPDCSDLTQWSVLDI